MDNRYLFYEMMGKYVRVDFPEHMGGRSIDGRCEDVFRDVFEGVIRFKFRSRKGAVDKVIVREPDLISRIDNKLIFVYGDGEDEISDEELMDEFKSVNEIGGCIYDAMENLDCDTFLRIEFEIKQEKENKK